MPNDNITYSEDEIQEWVERDKAWCAISEWQAYLLGRKQSYISDRQRALGYDYHSSSAQWDIIFEREWLILEERLKGGIGLDDGIIEKFGEGFFDENSELMKELESMTKDLDSEDVGKNKSLTIYTFEDFLMLSNQGIFRDNIFILDPQRKWRKKVEEIIRSYGYEYIERMNIRGENYLIISKEEY